MSSSGRRPDFFIVGAPKCGTTALYSYLSAHPSVFMPANKEPHHFADDLSSPYYVRSPERYGSLFADAAPDQCIGEASVWYLFSRSAALRIRREVPEARLIVMLRRPDEMYLSLHNQMLASLYENEADPERAWRLQQPRRHGRQIPRLCDEPRFLQYREICSLGAQARRLLEVFERRQVLPLLFDDLVTSPREVYSRALGFLGLPDDGRHSFPKVNEAHQPRWRLLEATRRAVDRKLVSRGLRLRSLARPLSNLSRRMRAVNTRFVQKPRLNAPFRRELRAAFRADIVDLSRVLGLDLSDWLDERSPEKPSTSGQGRH